MRDNLHHICIFLDPVILKAEEMTEVVLNFTEPGSGGPYEEITWYKDQTGRSQYRIVFLHSSATGGEPQYYNEFCSGSSPCETSSKGELNVNTGELTIYSVAISDEGFYYYDFYIDGGTADTGHKYEIHTKVSGELTKIQLINTNLNVQNYIWSTWFHHINLEIDANITSTLDINMKFKCKSMGR